MKLIFGHACNHAFIDPIGLDYWNTLDSVKTGMPSNISGSGDTVSATWDELYFAVCDFTNPGCYDEVSLDFGRELPVVDYTPYTGLSAADNWTIQQTFHWNEVWSPDIPSARRLRRDGYYYLILYTPVSDIISLSDWYHTHTEKL